MGSLTGWKAVLVAIPIVAFIALKAVNSTPHYREFSTQEFEVPAGLSYLIEIESDKDGKIKADISNVSGSEYVAYIVTDANYQQLEAIATSGVGDPTSVPTLIEHQTKAPHVLNDVELKAGNYYLVIECLGEATLTGTVTLSEFR